MGPRIILALGIVLAFGRDASAQPESPRNSPPEAVRLHVGSWHDRGDFNNANLGAALRWRSGLTVGGFQNSLDRPSFYGGLVVPVFDRGRLRLELMAGMITGYSEASPVDVVAVPILGWRMSSRNSLQVVFMPRFVIPANAVHLMFERRWGGKSSPAESVP
jgi:hypothetical protein